MPKSMPQDPLRPVCDHVLSIFMYYLFGALLGIVPKLEIVLKYEQSKLNQRVIGTWYQVVLYVRALYRKGSWWTGKRDLG